MRLAILSLAMSALFVNPAVAQDERFWRKMLSGELTEEIRPAPPEPKWVFAGPQYHLDLDGDGKLEAIQMFKRDGVDWLDILSHERRSLLSAKLWAMGGGSGIYKLRLVSLSPKLRVLVVFLNEGKTESKRLESTARLYFVSLENQDLATLKLAPGPRYWHEFEGQREQYGRRLYSLNVKDYNNDGVKDLAVDYNHMQSVWLYQGDGRWLNF